MAVHEFDIFTSDEESLPVAFIIINNNIFLSCCSMKFHARFNSFTVKFQIGENPFESIPNEPFLSISNRLQKILTT